MEDIKYKCVYTRKEAFVKQKYIIRNEKFSKQMIKYDNILEYQAKNSNEERRK